MKAGKLIKVIDKNEKASLVEMVIIKMAITEIMELTRR
jgi:hypothetical protein